MRLCDFDVIDEGPVPLGSTIGFEYIKDHHEFNRKAKEYTMRYAMTGQFRINWEKKYNELKKQHEKKVQQILHQT